MTYIDSPVFETNLRCFRVLKGKEARPNVQRSMNRILTAIVEFNSRQQPKHVLWKSVYRETYAKTEIIALIFSRTVIIT